MKAWTVTALLAALATAAWPMPAWASRSETLAAPDVRAALTALTSGELPAAVRRRNFEAVRAQLAQLYARRGDVLLWSRELRPTVEALSLVRILTSADAHGLIPDDYQAAALAQTVQSLPQSMAGLDQWAQFDLRLSLAALAFITDLHRGRIDPRAAGFELPQDRSGFDAAAILEQLAGPTDPAALLERIVPQYIHYRLLEQALARFRQLALQPDLTQLPALPAAKVAAGGRYAGAPALRRLLAALNCLPAPGSPSATSPPATLLPAPDPLVLDGELVAGLKRFQALYGLQVDGTLGRTTYAALTVPLAQRVRQIELTLERWRWLPPLQAPSIIVNIPEFRLFAPSAGQDREDQMLRMDVIVGRQYARTRTPVFSADMKYVVFRPYWDVPRSILLHEILPLLAKNPRYLETQEMQIVRGESDEGTVLPADTREPSGAGRGSLAAAAATGRRQRARADQIHAAERPRCLPALDPGAAAVRTGAPHVQPRLHPCQRSGGAGRAGTEGRPRGLDAREDHRGDEWQRYIVARATGNARACADRLRHRDRVRGRCGAFLRRHLWL